MDSKKHTKVDDQHTLLDNLDSVTKNKASILIEKGMEVTGVILTRISTGEKCSVNLGRVNWANVRDQNIEDFGA